MEILIILLVTGIAVFLIEGRVPVPIQPNGRVQKIAQAIAKAEGFYASRGPNGEPTTVPQRAHNPGDLELGDVGYGVISAARGNKITIYPSDAQGWSAIYRIVEGWLENTSHVYNSQMTIDEIASHYVGDSGAFDWAQNVSDTLGVDSTTPIGQVS